MADQGLEKGLVRDPCGFEKTHDVFSFGHELQDCLNGYTPQTPLLATDLNLDVFGDFPCKTKSLLNLI